MRNIEILITALKNGTIEIIQNPNDNCIAAKCGEYWFYFAGAHYENMSPNEFKKNLSISEAAYMIAKAIDGLDVVEQDYYKAILNEMPKWSEVKCDYLNETDHFWAVDAYESDIDYWTGEECSGEVIAYIDDYSGRVIVVNDSGWTKEVQDVVNAKVKECKTKHPYSVDELESLLSNVVDFEAEEDPNDAFFNLEAFGFSEDQMRFFGFDPDYEE